MNRILFLKNFCEKFVRGFFLTEELGNLIIETVLKKRRYGRIRKQEK